jgi:hypothetical protein
MKYKIKLWYSTGDSHGSEDTSGVLEMEWANLDIAKENLRRIKEHYICYKVDSCYSGKKGYYFNILSPEHKLMYNTKEQKDWYIIEKFWKTYHHSIVLKTDNGDPWQISPFWVGYFENLKEGKIISEGDDTHFEF